MLVIPVDVVASCISFFAGLPECRFSVPAPESHRSVVSLSLFTQEVLAKSYPIQSVILL